MISVGNIKIGNRNFIPVQTMLKNPVWEIDKTLEKIERLEKIGCDILRITVPDQQALAGLKEILKITTKTNAQIQQIIVQKYGLNTTTELTSNSKPNDFSSSYEQTTPTMDRLYIALYIEQAQLKKLYKKSRKRTHSF